jgi:pimeloyl-ACP methyl ester carboxylesterase
MTSPTKPNPVIFIHGLWIHATAWQPWLDHFENNGYAVSAPGWPGERATVAQTRENPDAMNNVGIRQMIDHYAGAIDARIGVVKPLVVGHSFGGLIAQALLAEGRIAAAVAIDPAPIKGVKALPLAQLRSAFPVLGNPANRHRTVSLTAKQFRYAFPQSHPCTE